MFSKAVGMVMVPAIRREESTAEAGAATSSTIRQQRASEVNELYQGTLD